MNEHQNVSRKERVKSLLFLPLIQLFGCLSKTARSLFAKRRKIAASLLSLILIVSMLPLGAFTVFAAEGDEPIAEINSVKYYDLQTAIDSVASGSTIKMLKNVELSSPITITGGKIINLDLNGKVIKGDQSVAMDNLFYLNTTGNLRISDSGTTGKIIGYPSVATEDSVFYIEKGSLYIDNVTIEAINLSYETKPQIGRAITLLGSSYLQLDRGRITGNVSTTVYAADLSRVTVTGGTIENLCEKPNNGMALRSASSNIINISGGTIYSKQYFALYAVNGKGAKVKVSGADTAIKSDSYTALYAAGSGTEVYVTGGKIDGYTAGKYDHAMKVRDSACATFTGGEVCNNGHGYGIGGNGKVYIAGGSPVFRTLDLSKVNMSGVDNIDNLLDLSDYLGDIYVSPYSDGWNLKKYTGTETKKHVTFSTEGYTPVKLNLVLNGGTYNPSVKPEYYASEKGYKLPPASKVSKTGYRSL